MEYKKINQYIEITIDNKFNNKTILDIFNTYRLSKKNIHELRMSKDVFLNDKMVLQNFNIILNTNDKLKFPIFIDEEIDFISQNISIDIVYEDDFILVINKQANIEVHPDTKDGLNTLVNGVANYYKKTNQKHKIRYIHRLDKDTTGAIIFVKNFFVHNLYDNLLSNKEIKRYYLALVKNKPPKNSDIIEEPIGKNRHHNLKRIVSKTGDYAKTFYNVKNSYNNYHLLEIEIFTGRTHQIRVHMAYINSPLLGDTLYGEKSELIARQALHAYKVLLIHPITLEHFTINVDIPYDMKKLINKEKASN